MATTICTSINRQYRSKTRSTTRISVLPSGEPEQALVSGCTRHLADDSLTLNLKAKKGQEIARKLVEDADVLVEN